MPYSLASSGPLRISGKTLVGGLDSADDVAELPTDGDIPDEDLLESGVISNFSGEAMILEGDVKVVGNAEAAGSIRKGSGVEILRGELKPHSDKKDMPTIDITDYDPLGRPSDPGDDRATLVQRTESIVPNPGHDPIYGFQRFAQDVLFPDGLVLDGSAVYVDGNVTLNGPLEGSGVLIATGDVLLLGGANMKADVLAAVIAGGDLTINGAASPEAADHGGKSTFQGLLYAQGDLTLSNTRSIGTLMSNGEAIGKESRLTIEDSIVLSTPDTQKFEIIIRGGPLGVIGGQAWGYFSGDMISARATAGRILEPRPADLLKDGVFDPALIAPNLRILLPSSTGGAGQIVNTPQEAKDAGLADSEFRSLKNAYDDFKSGLE